MKNATTGFNGGAASGFSTVAGLDPTTTKGERWKNYTAQYTNVTKDDLIKKMRTAHRKIQFKTPVDIPDFRRGNGAQYRIYTNESVLNEMELLGEAQNENIGRDIAYYDDSITFRKHAIVWVPKLDSDIQNPVYMLDMSQFYPVVMEGLYLRETDPKPAPLQHLTMVVHVDLKWNAMCVDRRAQAVLATA